MNVITSEDKEIMNTKSDQTLAEWYCVLNNWGWPDELPDPESRDDRKGRRRSELMKYMEERVGHRLVMRTWNKEMPDEEFNDFYAGTYLGDKKARHRHEVRRHNRIKSLGD